MITAESVLNDTIRSLQRHGIIVYGYTVQTNENDSITVKCLEKLHIDSTGHIALDFNNIQISLPRHKISIRKIIIHTIPLT